jgi:hypothetical protein
MKDNFLPTELAQKCFALAESTHERIGFGTLPKVMVTGENMVPLGLVPDAFKLIGSVGAIHKLRIVSWLVGLAMVAGGLMINHWIFLGLVVVLIADRKLSSEERRQWMLLAAFKLALEMLATNFAGWGNAYSSERKTAMDILGDKGRTTLLDFYLPRHVELEAPLLKAFGPGGV